MNCVENDRATQWLDFIEEAPVGFHQLDAQGRIVRVNQTELRFLGYVAEEMVGRSVADFVVGGEREMTRIRGKLAGYLPVGRPEAREFRRKDGTLVPVVLAERAILDRQGKIAGL
ncbi:MAG: PAS domain S-box protein [Verrucomicrobia bacterium]|nr:PAS domain S-box protein [Verrucomicrobiota bacterium]